jgi:NADPH:quinone reductase-like Zn-dependent oxidoreductase
MSDFSANSMLAMLLTGHGDLDRLEVRPVPIPTPNEGEVLVRLGGAAVNNTDINLRVGWYSKSVSGSTDGTVASPSETTDAGWAGDALTFPRIQGADGAGRIVAVGNGVPASRIGERILIDPIIRVGAQSLYFGSDVPGSFAQYTCVPSVNAVHIDSPLSDPELASFPCSYLAALHMVSRAGVSAGQTVVITGASGGVGAAAVQWCRARGARIVAIAEESKHLALQELGADQLLGRTALLADSVGADTVDVVLDVVGGAGFNDRLVALKPHGHYATAGAIAGPVVDLDLRTLYLKDLTLHGCTIPRNGLFAELVRAIETGLIRPQVAMTYPLHDLREAQSTFLRKAHLGKIAIRID